MEEASNPERSKIILLINSELAFDDHYPFDNFRFVLPPLAPTIFPFCYNIVKHVLDEKTRKKVVVIGANSEFVWLSEAVLIANRSFASTCMYSVQHCISNKGFGIVCFLVHMPVVFGLVSAYSFFSFSFFLTFYLMHLEYH